MKMKNIESVFTLIIFAVNACSYSKKDEHKDGHGHEHGNCLEQKQILFSIMAYLQNKYFIIRITNHLFTDNQKDTYKILALNRSFFLKKSKC